MNSIYFKQIEEKHIEKALEIYTYYVLNTNVTFHDHQLSIDEMKELVIFNNYKYRTYIIIENETICGYVILKQYKVREAYNGTAEVTIYLDSKYIGKRIGSLALQYIEEYAKTQSIHVLVASICGENERSIKLFERQGYFKCAHYKEVGKKFGQLLDVVAYQKIL